jgi:hypothetical protein
MHSTELQWLFEQAKGMKSIVELGSWKGRSTHALASGCTGMVFAIDHFQGTEYLRSSSMKEAVEGTIKQQFLTNLDSFTNVCCCEGDTAKAAVAFGEAASNPIDMLFVDADHSYSAVKAELLAWWQIPRKLLAGHDRYENGLPRIVSELLLAGVKIEPGPGTLWFVRDPRKYWERVQKVWEG